MKAGNGLIIMFLVLAFVFSGCGDEITNSSVADTSPDTPTGVTATGGKFITLDWDSSPGLCYNLYWNTTGGVTASDNVLYNVSLPYEHSGLIYNGTTYYYAVTAFNCDLLIESGLSSEVSAVSEITVSDLSKHIASDAENSDVFGSSVSINGDYAIVGATGEDGAGNNRGAAYVLYRNQGGTDNWGEVKKLTASDSEDIDVFGSSVSMIGDYAIVGALYKKGGGIDRGAAYVFYRNQGGTDNWGEVKKLTASDAANNDNFGSSVSISGDYAIVGARYKNSYGVSYVFYRNQGGMDNWGEVKKLTASDAANNDVFGHSVSISGDYVIVGAFAENGAGIGRGAAYVFYRNEGGTDNWGEVKKLTASDPEDNDYFGHAVSISGDYAIVGANWEDGGGIDRGAAYVFYRNEGGTDNWGEVKKLTASDTENNDEFGYSVSISGDYAIVGANWENGAGSNRGAAYVFYRNQGGTDNWGEVKKLVALDVEDYDLFGYSVSINGDNAIIGAIFEDGEGTDRGAAYIY